MIARYNEGMDAVLAMGDGELDVANVTRTSGLHALGLGLGC